MGGPLALPHGPPGLSIIADAITADREAELVAWIEELPPAPVRGRQRLDLYGDGPFVLTSMGRHVAHVVPPVLAGLAAEVCHGICSAISISEYLPGQGVREHVDRAEAGPVIQTLALLADAELVFRRQIRGYSTAMIFDRVEVPFPRRALMQMRDPCRSSPWTHELAPVTERRISIAFRGFAA